MSGPEAVMEWVEIQKDYAYKAEIITPGKGGEISELYCFMKAELLSTKSDFSCIVEIQQADEIVKGIFLKYIPELAMSNFYHAVDRIHLTITNFFDGDVNGKKKNKNVNLQLFMEYMKSGQERENIKNKLDEIENYLKTGNIRRRRHSRIAHFGKNEILKGEILSIDIGHIGDILNKYCEIMDGVEKVLFGAGPENNIQQWEFDNPSWFANLTAILQHYEWLEYNHRKHMKTGTKFPQFDIFAYGELGEKERQKQKERIMMSHKN